VEDRPSCSAHGLHVEDPRIRLEELWRQRMANKSLAILTTQTSHQYAARHLRGIMPFEVRKLTLGHIERAYEEMSEKGYGEETTSSVHRAMSSIFSVAERKGCIHHNVMRQPPSVPAKEVEISDMVMWRKFLIYCEPHGQDDLVMFLRLAFHTGARVGELYALRWTDIRGSVLVIGKTTVNVRDGQRTKDGTKTGKTCTVSLSPNGRDAPRVGRGQGRLHLLQGRRQEAMVRGLYEAQVPTSARGIKYRRRWSTRDYQAHEHYASLDPRPSHPTRGPTQWQQPQHSCEVLRALRAGR
jgi:integrase